MTNFSDGTTSPRHHRHHGQHTDANPDPPEVPEGTDAEQTPDVNKEEGERELL